jgi:hypothetical protein
MCRFKAILAQDSEQSQILQWGKSFRLSSQHLNCGSDSQEFKKFCSYFFFLVTGLPIAIGSSLSERSDSDSDSTVFDRFMIYSCN